MYLYRRFEKVLVALSGKMKSVVRHSQYESEVKLKNQITSKG
jgi:hypothetical protein